MNYIKEVLCGAFAHIPVIVGLLFTYLQWKLWLENICKYCTTHGSCTVYL